MPNPPLRLALVGLGNQGMEHLNAAAQCDSVVFVAGVDPDPATRQRVTDSGASLKVLADLQKLHDYKLDGLVLALPHHKYTESWQDLIDFRLPILKEKPLGRSFDEALALIERARLAGCPVQTAIQRRHHPSYLHLKQLLQAREIRVLGVHAHMHLGLSDTTGGTLSWRSQRHTSGGGALLDAGYHLVDLLHFLFGPFDLVSASLWNQGAPAGDNEVDDRAWLVGRSEQGWVMLDSWRSGHINAQTGKPGKSERVILETTQGLFEANREGVWHQGECIVQTERDWGNAMADQLTTFARHIEHGQWHDDLIWDQLPAMRVIDEAYRLAARY